MLNAEALLTGRDVPYAMSLTGVRSAVLAIPRQRFGRLVAQDEDIQHALMRSFAHRAQEHETWRGHVGEPLETRVWSFLAGLERRHGYRLRSSGVVLQLGLTQQEIASALGVSTSSVEGAMRRLRESGQLRTGYAELVLHALPSEPRPDLR